jgi:hypothetical protein
MGASIPIASACPRAPPGQLRQGGDRPGTSAPPPAGEPPPLPRRLGRTGWWWLGLGTIAIIAPTLY